MKDARLLLIDGNSLLYRAFYALPLLHTQAGEYTNGVYGFLTMYRRAIKEVKPTHVLVAFDMEKKSFRHESYEDYKANRSAPPDELKPQFALLREVLSALKIPYVEMPGYEADDLIGTYSRMAEEEGMETVILTGDRDALQLVSDQVKVMLTRKGISEVDLYDVDMVREKWQVDPELLIEVKALMGDAADNIPGVPGVGEKTALKLVRQYQSLENIYEHIDEIRGKKLKQNLLENRDIAFLSRELGTIVRDVAVEDTLDEFVCRDADHREMQELFSRLEFRSLLTAMEKEMLEVSDASVELRENTAVEVVEIENREDAVKLCERAGKHGMGLYIKADYHHPMWARIEDIYLEAEGTVYHLDVTDNIEKIEWLRTWIESEQMPKYMHNSKYMQVLLKNLGLELRGIHGDTLLACYVLDPAFDGEDLANVIGKELQMDCRSSSEAFLAAQIRPVYEAMAGSLSEALSSLLWELEMPLSSVLAAMEFCGVAVKEEILHTIGEELEGRIERDENEIYRLAGCRFNVNSPKQLGKVLFEDLQLPVIKKTKTGYSTSQEVLEKLYDQHPIIPYIMDYRQLSKLKSTYADALQKLIHPRTGRIHTIFKQATTATGRLSSVEPNLQNIPIRLEEGRRIRKAFVAPQDDWVLLSADYSQIDLRSLAHISNDKALIETFQAGIDIHRRTAAQIFNVPLEEVSEDLRYRAKAVNFGIIYGISDFGLARDTGVSRKEAREYIENYLASYPGVQRYMEEIVAFGKRHGYVETVLKRRRFLPDLNAKNKVVQSFARRMALNTPIQGTSADIIKLAMIRVARELQEQRYKARMLVQVHDELVLELPRTELEPVGLLVKNCMENAYQLRVPLEVAIQYGENWYEMKEIVLEG